MGKTNESEGIVEIVKVLSYFAVSPVAFSLALIKFGASTKPSGHPSDPIAVLVGAVSMAAGVLTLPATIPLCAVTSALAVADGIGLAVTAPVRAFKNYDKSEPVDTATDAKRLVHNH